MDPLRRNFIKRAAGFVAMTAAPRIAAAQSGPARLTYPTRPVRLLVGFPPGSASDINARLVGAWLSDRLGQQFVIENRPGAASNIATEDVVRAAPDGYTLLYVTPPNAINATLYKHLGYDFLRDIAAVAGVARTPGVMEVGPSVAANTVAEFVAYAKANPGKINMATLGPGSGQHLFGELFMMMTGVELVPVHYHGATAALTDLIGGRVDVMFDIVVSSIAQIKAGKLRALGVTTMAPVRELPGVPPIADTVSGYEAAGFQGIGAPAKTPEEIIRLINREVSAALDDAPFNATLAELGGIPFAASPESFGQFLADETEKWGKVVRAAHVEAE